MPALLILSSVLKIMESTGTPINATRISIDEHLVRSINEDNKTDYTLDEIKKATDKCLAHEWLETTGAGSKYLFLQVTSKGLAVASSKKKAFEQKKSRTLAKKVSDYIEDHKGWFLLLGFLVTLATFLIKYIWIS
ncbi:MAG: hypothetical protein ACI9YH_004248 [Colwellia sp.]|jgi:hypothetical protein